MVQNRAVVEAVFNVTAAIRNAADAASQTSNSLESCANHGGTLPANKPKGLKEGVGQQLWRKVKAANGLYREFNIPILETSTALFSSPLDVANLIGKTFASVSSSDSYRPAFQATKNRLERTPINFRCRQPLPYNCDFDMFELKRVLSSAHNTSPGPDGISYVLLRHLSEDSLASLYVDDLQISCEGSDMRMIERQLQTAVNNILKWCDTNGHSISASKSCCVHFCRKRGIHPDPEIRIRDIQIPVVPDVRFLGVIFDRQLTFLPHILHLRKRCEKSLNLLKVLSNTSWGADRTSLLRVYKAIVLSRIDYGCVAYGSACNSTLLLRGLTFLSPRRDTAVGLVLQIRGVGFTRWILALMLYHYILGVLQVSAVPGFLPDDRHTASLVGLRGGWRHARMKFFFCTHMDPSLLCQGKGLVLPNLSIDETAQRVRFLLISLPNNAMSVQSPFKIHKALKGIGGEPKSVKRLRSGDLLVETSSSTQTKSFLLAKTFLNSPVNIIPHKSLNTSRGVISEPDLLATSEAEILEGFSNQGSFSSPTLPQTIKAGYLNCKIRPYIPNPLHCFKCQRFGHSQTACRGQLTCSRCASVGHSSADCSLAQKCVNCSQPHSSDSKQCPKWKTEKEIQAFKTNRNISYLEARKLIAPQLSQSYAQVAKPSTVTSTTQTDENITQIKCPPLQLLQPLLSVPQPDKSNSVSTLSSATQADLLLSTSSIAATISEPPHLIPVSDTLLSTTSNMFTPIEPSSSIISASTSNSSIQPPSASSTQNLKKKSKFRDRKRKKEVLKSIIDIKMAQHRPSKPAPVEYSTDDKDMIVYDVDEDAIESNPDYVRKDGKTFFKGSLLLTPTRSRR
ncbi:putative RNA-directed DNA polymerase from transposon X-element [Trichonephila clavipes]|nr:putative RNA-directed DNA polymerase from transposon X-element [Trichonephila clavipes]